MLEFTWPGFFFAIVNFLILVVLLYRFLHKPLLNALDARRERIEGAERKAEEEAAAAAAQRRDYEAKVDGIEEERDRLLSGARRASEEARDQMLEAARGAAEREAANVRTAFERERIDALGELQEEIVSLALQTAEDILKRVADGDLDARLHQALLDELGTLASRGDEFDDGGAAVRVVSAKDVDDARRSEILAKVRQAAPEASDVEFATDERLVAGARVEFSALAVDASVADAVQAVRQRMTELAAGEEESTS